VTFYRLPQAVLTWIFPNDYVYRFAVSVTFEGKTYTGDTVSACRIQRSPFPDPFEDTFGDRWHMRLWATPLTVSLPGNRFLLIPALNVVSCHESPERPDPAWKRWLGLVSPHVAGETPFDPFSVRQTFGLQARRPVLFDDAVAPRQSTVLYTREGAVTLGVDVSLVSTSPATWRDVENHLARRSGAPWIAPVVEQCVTGEQGPCSIHRARGFRALSVSLAEAMQVPAFARWARQAERLEHIAQVPPEWRPLIGLVLERYFRAKPRVALAPNWTAARWHATDQTDLAHVVFPNEWPGSLAEPVLCTTDDGCVAFRRSLSGYTVVDWSREKVVVASPVSSDVGIIVLRGELQ
jgi:hypothetical protein